VRKIAREVRALTFDVFGTVVDWRTSLINDFTKGSETSGVKADWTALVDGWRGVYMASMDEVRKHPERGYQILDTLHRRSLEKLVADMSIKGLSDADLHYLTMGWHRLHAWPDSVAGLHRLKSRFAISTLSNGNVALLVDMARHAGLPWDCVLSGELIQKYKPDPAVYLMAARLLGCAPAQLMLVAAHPSDLQAAKACGLRTAYVHRALEFGAEAPPRPARPEGFDLIASDFLDLARQLSA
jgi:2-haloacid dehalogenase